MKKILSLALAVLMLVSALPVAYAAEGEHDYSNGTQITLVGTQEEAAGGAGDVWTVTVPAKMVPGDTGTVKAEGTWAADKFLNVGAPSTVTLTYGAQSMDVAITGGQFSLIGNSAEAVSKEVEIAVEDASRLFGTWEGILVYQVDLIQKGDVNRDGMITQEDVDLCDSAITDLVELTAEQFAYADMNGDKTINSQDSTALGKILEGLYTKQAINGTAATE